MEISFQPGPAKDTYPRLGGGRALLGAEAGGKVQPLPPSLHSKPVMLWVNSEGKINGKPAHCWHIPREGSKLRGELSPSRKQGEGVGAAAWLCTVSP